MLGNGGTSWDRQEYLVSKKRRGAERGFGRGRRTAYHVNCADTSRLVLGNDPG